MYGNSSGFRYQAEYWTQPLIWKNNGLNSPKTGLECGFTITTAAWVHSHSDVVVAAVSLEPAEPPPSKKGYVKTKNLLSGDLTTSLVLSSHLAPHQSHFQRPMRLYCQLPHAPGDGSHSPLEMPLKAALPHRGISWRNLTAAGLLHLHSSWPLCNDTEHLTHSSGATSKANVTIHFLFYTTTRHLIPNTPFNTHAAMRQMAGTCCDGCCTDSGHTGLFLPKYLCCLPETHSLWTLFCPTQQQNEHCIYKAFFPYLCWIISIAIFCFLVFALAMPNKPEASTTANTKIEFVYKNERTNTCWGSLSIYREHALLHDSTVSLTDWSSEIKQVAENM